MILFSLNLKDLFIPLLKEQCSASSSYHKFQQKYQTLSTKNLRIQFKCSFSPFKENHVQEPYTSGCLCYPGSLGRLDTFVSNSHLSQILTEMTNQNLDWKEQLKTMHTVQISERKAQNTLFGTENRIHCLLALPKIHKFFFFNFLHRFHKFTSAHYARHIHICFS